MFVIINLTTTLSDVNVYGGIYVCKDVKKGNKNYK